MKIVCKNCGWSWNRNDGGVNPCKCHKCGYNNKDMYSNRIIGLGNTKSKDIEKAKKEYYSIIKYLKKRNIPFIVKEINKGRKIPIHQRDIKIIGKPNVRMIDILQIMKSDVILALGK